MFGILGKNKAIFIFVLFCVFAISPINCLFATGDDVISTEELDDILKTAKEAIEIAKNIDLEEYKEAIEEATNRETLKIEKIRKFNNKVLFKIPLLEQFPYKKVDDLNVPVNITVRYGDIINFILFGVDIVVDKWLFITLSNYYTDTILKRIDNDRKNFISLLEKINSVSNQYTQEINPEEEIYAVEEIDSEEVKNYSQEKLEQISLRFKDLEEELFSYVKKEHSLNYSKIIKDLFIKKMFLYVVYSELTLLLKDWLLGPREITSFKQLWANNSIKNSWLHVETTKEDGTKEKLPLTPSSLTKMLFSEKKISEDAQLLFEPEISFNFFSVLKFMFNSYTSSPLTTGTHFITHLISKNIIDPFKCYVNEDGKVKRMFPFNFLDSYICLLLKEALILAKTMKTLDFNLYSKRWFSYIKNNFDELLDLLKSYEIAPSKSKSEMKEKIKEFINRGLEVNFQTWLRSKNSAFLSSENRINLLFAIPTTFIIGKWIYEKYKDGTIDKIWGNLQSSSSSFSLHSKRTQIMMAIAIPGIFFGGILLLAIYNIGKPNY